jgi:hypothetical protein
MSRHLVHFNLQIALGLTQIVFLAGGSAIRSKVSRTVRLIERFGRLGTF